MTDKKELYKVKIIKAMDHITYYDDYASLLYPVSIDWEEVTHDEMQRIQAEVDGANHKGNNGWRYIMIVYSNYVDKEVTRLASEWKAEQEKCRQKEEARKELARKKKEEKSAERKVKLLEKKIKEVEKLKKELDDEG